METLRPKIVKLAKMIGGISGMTVKITKDVPEYYCMENIVSDDEADLALAAGLRTERTIGYLAKKVGKTVDEIMPLADNLVQYGIFRRVFQKDLGEDTYYVQIFAPGILEMMVNNKKLLAEHPEVGRAFEEYTRLRMRDLGPILPQGYGLMRVCPVEDAIKDLPGVSPYERLSYYLDKYDRFCVSDCSCRSSRTSIGDGCGHLATEMCIQMGKGAEHYIRSGRAREITKEEALEIIHRAEENGLMHNLVNIEEPGESSAICNCCSCACFGLRAGLMWGARDAIRSNFEAYVDESKCVACGQCVENCPANAVRLGQKLCSSEAIPGYEGLYTKLSETFDNKKAWNVDYRENMQDSMPGGTAPCKAACPAHIAVQGYLKLAAQGRYTEALELIKKENPFPAVCGRICNKRCEQECTRGGVDEAVAIDEVKRFIADHDLDEKTRFVPKMLNQIGKPYTRKIAVIGAGPAGMSCAYYLANKGYPVTVFDKNPVPGGMLVLGIPNFRLEKDVLNAEIDILREMGVTFKCGVEVGKDVTIQQLRDEGFEGFYLAIGAQKSAPIGVPGDQLTGVYGGVDFLREVNLGKKPKIGKKCAVIGGGNVAMDVCRTAIRLGAKDTYVIYRRSRDEMPADPEEVQEAMEEGVQFRFLSNPVAIEGDSKVTDIRVEIMELSEPDEKGRRKPVGTGKFETIEVDSVIGAIGQKVDMGGLGEDIKVNEKGLVIADPLTQQTSVKDIFAGGDVVTGPKFAIDAIAAGKEGSISLHRAVNPGQTLTMGRDRRIYRELDKEHALIPVDGFDKDHRQVPGYNKEKAKTFSDARMTFTEEQVKKECARCLGCGAAKVDSYLCIGCGQCTTKCKFDAIKLRKVRDWHAGTFETLPIHAAMDIVKKVPKVVRKAVEK